MPAGYKELQGDSETGSTICKGESSETRLLRQRLKLNVKVYMAFRFHKPLFFFFIYFKAYIDSVNLG